MSAVGSLGESRGVQTGLRSFLEVLGKNLRSYLLRWAAGLRSFLQALGESEKEKFSCLFPRQQQICLLPWRL